MAAAAGSGPGTGRAMARPRPGAARFRGCLAGALLGDCLGAVFEGRSVVKLPDLLRFLRGLEPASEQPEAGEPAGSARRETLSYTDDTAMSRSVVQSLLAKREFDEVDMAKRFAEEYKKEPNRGYGMAVVNVFKKLLSPKCNDVFEPARAQFNGKGSYGNGGAMRVAGVSLAYPDVQDVKKFAKLSAELTHANSLGYNGAILQALAVHLALQGGLSKETFLEQLISHMEDVEADDKSLTDARALGFEDLPFSRRLKKIKEFLELSSVPKADVLFELVTTFPLSGSRKPHREFQRPRCPGDCAKAPALPEPRGRGSSGSHRAAPLPPATSRVPPPGGREGPGAILTCAIPMCPEHRASNLRQRQRAAARSHNLIIRLLISRAIEYRS
ncbi:ADP-ribosylhydrolase ARH3 isoform X1 [Opisthocomus hoazin]|uniref:ADP-ribosylhydrolase ARH3 isoform X1 n=1 Tax=Opisthocomus hoazin TaxID=30419 RepID=UPI003F5391B3